MTTPAGVRTEKPLMCIVGFGRMGKRAAAVFSKGFRVEIISSRDVRREASERNAVQSDDPIASLATADYVFLALPIALLETWVPQLNEATKSGCVVIDCCTVRSAAKDKLTLLQRRHFGLPEIGDDDTPVDGEIDMRIKEYLEREGVRLSPLAETTTVPKPVAGIAHFIGMALDLNLTEEERVEMELSGAGRHLLNLIEHLKSNSCTTYMETQFLQPGMSSRRKEIIEWMKSFDRELDNGVFNFKPHDPTKWRP